MLNIITLMHGGHVSQCQSYIWSTTVLHNTVILGLGAGLTVCGQSSFERMNSTWAQLQAITSGTCRYTNICAYIHTWPSPTMVMSYVEQQWCLSGHVRLYLPLKLM
jgi:hypothetical protein